MSDLTALFEAAVANSKNLTDRPDNTGRSSDSHSESSHWICLLHRSRRDDRRPQRIVASTRKHAQNFADADNASTRSRFWH